MALPRTPHKPYENMRIKLANKVMDDRLVDEGIASCYG